MASREIENSLIDPDQDHREESSEHNDEVVRLRQQLIDLHRAWASGMPPPPLSEGLGNISNCPPLSQAQFSAPTESPEHAPGFTPRHYYPGSSGVPLAAPQSRPAAQPAPLITPVFVAPPPHETPIYVAHPTMRLPRSASEPVLKVSDGQYYAPEPTLQMNEPYGYT